MPSRERECTVCISGTLACVHFDGKVLVLSAKDEIAEEDLHRPPCSTSSCGYSFHVDSGADKQVNCRSCGIPNRVNIDKYTCHTTEPEARAEFARRAEAMRLAE